MTENDFNAFNSLLQGIAECYGQSLSACGIALYFKLLESADFSVVKRASFSILSTRKYTTMPTPADFLEHIQRALYGASLEDKAELEVGKVLSAIRSHGAYASVLFDEPVTQAVIMRTYGGWAKLCSSCGVEETEYWFRKNFAKTWTAYARQNVGYFLPLAGLTEISNGAKGYLNEIPKPKIIGDKVKAKAMLEACETSPLFLGQRSENVPDKYAENVPVVIPVSDLLSHFKKQNE